MEGKARHKKKQQLQKQEEVKQRHKELMVHIKPLLLTFVVWFAITFFMHIPAIGDFIAPYFVGLTAHSTYFFGKVFFLPVELYNVSYISVNNFTMEVVMECTAYNFYVFVIVLTVFARWSVKHKLTSLSIFLLVIFVMNILRFIVMGYVGSYAQGYFDEIHDYFWNIIFGFLVFGIWVWRELKFQKKDAKQNTKNAG